MLVKINSLNKQIDKKDLEKFTRKLYIHRQKDRLVDEGGNGMRNKTTKITKKDFEAYVRVQRSGVTNMWAVDYVSKLSGLTKDKIFYIMDGDNYRKLGRKFKIIKDWIETRVSSGSTDISRSVLMRMANKKRGELKSDRDY